MSDLYSNIHALCEKEGIKDGTLCSNIGIRRSFISELKAGRTKSLSTEVLSKIAAYFNVSVDYLLTGNQKENPPQQPQSEVDAALERIRRKLESMPKEQREALMNLIEKMYFKQLRKNQTFSSHPLLHIREAKNCNDND